MPRKDFENLRNGIKSLLDGKGLAQSRVFEKLVKEMSLALGQYGGMPKWGSMTDIEREEYIYRVFKTSGASALHGITFHTTRLGALRSETSSIQAGSRIVGG